MRRELETAVSAATVAEAQEAQAANEAREADGRVAVAKILGGNRGTRGFEPGKSGKVWKTPGKGMDSGNSMEHLMDFMGNILENYENSIEFYETRRFKPLNIGFNQNMVLLPTMFVKATIILCITIWLFNIAMENHHF